MPRGLKGAAGRRAALREMLTRLRDEVYVRVKELRTDQEQESEPNPGDSMEQARASADIETHASLIGLAEQKLKLFDEAIECVQRGAYGICADCGDDIAVERLKAVPFALYCLNCQAKRPTGAPPGGAMIAPYDHQWTLPEEMRQPREYRVSTNIARPGPSVEEIATTPPHRKRRE
jgi:DnaK suppressor protein